MEDATKGENGARAPLELDWSTLKPELARLAKILPNYGDNGTRWSEELQTALATPGTPIEVLSIAVSTGVGHESKDVYMTHLVDVGMSTNGVHYLARFRGQNKVNLALYRADPYGSVMRVSTEGKDEGYDTLNVDKVPLINSESWRSAVTDQNQPFIEIEPYRIKEYSSLDPEKPAMVEAKWYVVNSEKPTEDNTPTRFW